MHPSEQHIGVVLAAGASVRMKEPKALLRLPDGTLLARRQADVLIEGGCRDVIVVLGHNHEALERELTGLRIAYNPHWESGRFSSVQTGLLAAGGYRGCVILPVDTAGIRPSTIAAVIACSEDRRAMAVRPHHAGKPGYALWLSNRLYARIRSLEWDGDLRMDDIVAPLETECHVDDPAVLNNLNTPAAWQSYLAALQGGKA